MAGWLGDECSSCMCCPVVSCSLFVCIVFRFSVACLITSSVDCLYVYLITTSERKNGTLINSAIFIFLMCWQLPL